ncbi:MAG TPA: phosphoribosylformylglycinamidine synthase subunit PurS, partial [Gemmatimonadaceae bacterium]
FAAVRDVHVGRYVVVEVDAADPAAAEREVRAMCERLLANPVTEDFAVASVEAAA